MKRKIVDYHVHSTHSCDGKSSISEMCQKANELEIAEVGFSEHLDLDPLDGCYRFFNYNKFTSDIERVKEAFRDKLIVRKGIEVTYQPCYEKNLKRWLQDKEFDYIIGSVHYIGHEFISPQLVANHDLKRMYEGYFKEVTGSIESGMFGVVGHFDFMRRCIDNQRLGSYEIDYWKSVKNILEKIKERGLFLEVNLKGKRDIYGDVTPSRQIINEYLENNGMLISIGSDAHSTRDLGHGIQEALSFLNQYKKDQVRIIFE